MARGRARKQSKAGSSKPNGAPGARINRIEKYEDTLEEGGVDDFMFKRDQIMFNPQDESEDEELADSGVEVLSLEKPEKGKGKARRAALQAADEDDEEEEEELPRNGRKEKVKADVSKRGRFGKPVEDSDESGEGSSGSGSEEDEEGWGRQYYSRPSTRREREDPNAYDEKRQEEKELEEAEVKRLQRKAREELSAEDWGLDGLDSADAVLTEAVPKQAEKAVEPVPETDDPVVLIKYLEKHEPVKIALAREWPLVARKLEKTARGIRKMEEEKDSQLFKGLGWLHYQTLLAYASTLAFYIHLASLPPSSRPNLSTHPIVPRLLQLKEGLAMLEDLDFDAASVSAHPEAGPLGAMGAALRGEAEEDEDEEELMELMRAKRELIARMQEARGAPGDDEEAEEDEDNSWKAQGLEDGELEELLRDADDVENSDAEEDDEDEDEEMDEDELEGLDGLDDLGDIEGFDLPPAAPKSKPKKIAKSKKTASPASSAFTPLAEPAFISSKSRKPAKSTPQIDERDLTGDPTILADADASDKAAKKRSLQFHTSKIAATVARREKARNTRLGGDEDVPYRDRQAARDAALRRNSGAAAGGAGAALDGEEEWSKEEKKRAREVREDEPLGEDDDGYYDLVKRRKTDQKEARAREHEEREAGHFANWEDESSEGPRALTRAIEKNRGLTPRRNKASRNPRVKKRIAYEKAKKKVASQRAVFKGGQASLGGRYGGEKTGISTTIKSSRF